MTTGNEPFRTSRRHFVRAGVPASLGLGLSGYLRSTGAAAPANAKPAAKAPGSHVASAKGAIVVFLGGGPTHMDTFDLKPDAPAEFRGEFDPIDTNVAGIRISEHLPRLARCADKYSILRVSHTQAAHELATRFLSTGNRPVPSLVYPGYGAVISKELAGDRDLPHFVAIPNTAQSAGYLGVRYAPLSTTEVPKPKTPFGVRGITLAEGLTVDQFEKNHRLLAQLDAQFAGPGSNAEQADRRLLDGLDEFARQAHDMITSPRAREAFDVSLEKPEVAEPFGESKFGQSCLLAVRLIEAGVRFATVSFGGWDTHGGNFKACKENLLPQLDEGLSALFTTLAAKGLLESTAVLVTGEFGRTPKINERAGRDHWPRSMFVLTAGGGFVGGRTFGESDAHGMGPKGEPITPEQVAATFYHTLGIDHRAEYHTSTGRPVMVVREGNVLPELLG